MTMLPKHSHHRAPLLAILSDNLPSSAAAGLLHSSASYIRDCKRQDPSSSDLLTEQYQRNTKRQRLVPDQLDAVFSFLASACSPVSGTAGPFRQFITDEDRKAVTEERINFGPSSAEELEPLFQNSSSRSFVYRIPHINRDPNLRPPINPLSLSSRASIVL